MEVLIIGGVAAGTKTAAKLKRLDRDASITILTKSRDISYAGCGLPYYVGNVIEEKQKLIVNTPAQFSALTGVRVLTEREVFSLDPRSKLVKARSLRTGDEECYGYDACVIATGASAIVPVVDGVNLSGVFTMRTPDDAVDMREYIESKGVKRAVVAGGGLIGLEMADNLALRGIAVTVIDMADQILPGFDPEMADYAKRHLEKKGIRVLTGTRLTSLSGTSGVEGVCTDGGEIRAELVVLSLGIRPNTGFLKDSGLEMTDSGLLLVDGQMKTNLNQVYAAGDCVSVVHAMTGERIWSPMGSTANSEGRVLAQVLAGNAVSCPGVLGTAVVKLPDLNCARTGLTESDAGAKGYDVESVVTVTDDKAHYYPGAAMVVIKLIADRQSRRLLGVQAMGAGAVDKINDIAVVALTMGSTLEQLENLDLSYAPPFSTAIHPFVTAVQILLNKLEGRLKSMTPAEFVNGKAKDFRIVDVSASPALPGTVHVDLTKVNGPVEGLDQKEKLLLVCNRGRRAYLLQNRLAHYGYENTLVLEGAALFNVIPREMTAESVTVSQDDIRRVKAFGFLHNKGTDRFNARVITRNGKITADESRCVTEAAARFGNGEIAMTTRLTLEIQGVPYENIEALRSFLAEEGLMTGGTGSKVRPVVSCKGTTCQYGLMDTYSLSERIHERFFMGYTDVVLPHKFKIAVGGCPNNCVKPNLNDLGVVGQRMPGFSKDACRGCKKCAISVNCPVGAAEVVEGVLQINEDICNSCGRCISRCPFHAMDDGTYGYQVYVGGRWGKKFAHGRALTRMFSSEEEVLSVIEKAILLFREQGITGERFADTIARIGFEEVNAQLLGNEILERKEAIIGAAVHMTGGATC